ncbi:Hypothetical predicted protein, partial [Cloeon dipterum]
DIMEVMMDRLRLDIAVTRLAKLQNLLDLACKEVLINILDGRIKGPQLVTVNLPTMLREHLMRVFEGKVCLPGHQSIEEFDRRYEAFKILLPARKIDLQALMSFCPIDSETRKSMFSKLCPNLEVLKLQNVIVGDDTNFIFDFAKLKQLYWKPSTSKKAHLSHILAAPDLETLELFGNSFNWEAIENVSRLVSNGKILCKLVTFKYVGSRPQVPYLHNDDEQYTDFFSAMSKLIKNSMAFIPKLCDDIMEVMMDRLRLDIAVTRLAKLQNLLDLACKEVLINILDGRIKGPQLVAVNLPNNLRNHLMRVFEGKMCLPDHQSIEEFDRRYEAFKILLPANKIDLQALMSFCPIDSGTRKSMFIKVMELIETKSPKVESLRIDLKRIISRECIFEISLLRDLKNLKKLEMPGCNIRLVDLMFLCRNKMPSLQHVQVEIISISEANLKNKKKLVKSLFNLRVLLFKEKNLLVASNDRLIKYKTWFECLCIDKLPNLKVFRQMADHTAGIRSTEKFKIRDKVRKNLQHLTTAQGVEGMHLMFPSVTHLRVDKMNEETDWRNLLQFPKIESLQICHSPSKAIEPFLVRYGANLRTLVLSEIEGVLFRQIFKLCPNLEVLKLQNVIVGDDTKFISNFAKLKQLYWKPYDPKKANISNILLAAPDLETLELFGNSFDWRDIEKVSLLISTERILRKLVTFNLFSAMSKLIKNSMAFIPKLCNISVFMCYGCISWNNIEVGIQIEDMTPDPSFCKCLTASVCEKLKDETISDFLDALKHRK